jgi:radical SAM protein with 4Fe4S-binding SPASM domain
MLTVINKNNLDDLRNIVDLAADLQFRDIQFYEPIVVDDTAEENLPSKEDLAAADIHGLKKHANSRGLTATAFMRREKVPPAGPMRCTMPWIYIFIRANGNVQPCCAIFGSDRAPVVGNIFEQDFSAIWNGRPLAEFRRTAVEGKNPLCAACPYY